VTRVSGTSVRYGSAVERVREGRAERLLTDPARGAGWDVAVARRLVMRDATALADLYDEFGSLVCGLAARITGNRQAAEDVTQEVFTSVWSRPETFDPTRGTLRGWLMVLAHRRAVDHVRREEAARRRTRAEDPPASEDSGDVVTSRAVARRVREAVQALPPEQRDAVWLAYFGGKTYREVATEMGIPEGTAKSRLRLALAHMACELEREGFGRCT
jgi:RNA polymerase sigma-70 factor (ECF subfamily)